MTTVLVSLHAGCPHASYVCLACANSGGGTGTGNDTSGNNNNNNSGPSQEELDRRYNEALAREAERLGVRVEDLDDATKNRISDEIRRSNGATSNNAEEKECDQFGDPVLISSGRYILDVEDIDIPGSVFSVERKYISEEGTTGSFGSGWLSSLDSRIVRGASRVDEGALREIGILISLIQELHGRMRTGSQTNEQRAMPRVVGSERQLNRANGTVTSNASSRRIADQVITNILQPAQSRLEGLQAIQERSRELSVLNGLSSFPGSPEYFEGVGNENLVLIDESGVPKVFEPFGIGVWIPLNYLSVYIRSFVL